ncbi:hypothetical protein SHIRM173S_01119 [Streptomyces hirsutus]
MYCWAMFLLVFTGSGALGLDRLFTRRPHGPRTTEQRTAERTPVAA